MLDRVTRLVAGIVGSLCGAKPRFRGGIRPGLTGERSLA